MDYQAKYFYMGHCNIALVAVAMINILVHTEDVQYIML